MRLFPRLRLRLLALFVLAGACTIGAYVTGVAHGTVPEAIALFARNSLFTVVPILIVRQPLSVAALFTIATLILLSMMAFSALPSMVSIPDGTATGSFELFIAFHLLTLFASLIGAVDIVFSLYRSVAAPRGR